MKLHNASILRFRSFDLINASSKSFKANIKSDLDLTGLSILQTPIIDDNPGGLSF